MTANRVSQHWRDMAQFESGIERKLMLQEAKDSEDMGSYPCPVPGCEGRCYHRPSVGGWWCDTCHKLDRF